MMMRVAAVDFPCWLLCSSVIRSHQATPYDTKHAGGYFLRGFLSVIPLLNLTPVQKQPLLL